MALPDDPASPVRHATRYPPPEDRAARLEGWKAIAGYLGRDVRTVQRWERSEALPVHRLEHHKQATAFALRDELDEWLRRRSRDGEAGRETGPDAGPWARSAGDDGVAAAPPVSPAGRRRWSAPLVGLLALALGLAGLLVWRAAPRGRGAAEGTRDGQAFVAFAQGQAFYNARQYTKAVAALERAVSRDPGFASAWAMLAMAHGRLAPPARAGGEPAAERATQAARRAAALAPREATVRVALALAARARGDVAEWRAEAQRALALDPRSAEAYALLGDSYSAMVYACGREIDAERADRYYRVALELKPDLSTAISNRATNLRRLGRYDECIDLAERALRTLNDETPLRFVRGSCRLAKGDLQGAAADLEPLRDSTKLSTVSPLVALGLLALKQGRTNEGARDLEAAARIQPGPLADLFIAEAYAEAGDIPRLAAHLRRAFAEDVGCRRFVAASPAFARVRKLPEIQALLDAPSGR